MIGLQSQPQPFPISIRHTDASLLCFTHDIDLLYVNVGNITLSMTMAREILHLLSPQLLVSTHSHAHKFFLLMLNGSMMINLYAIVLEIFLFYAQVIVVLDKEENVVTSQGSAIIIHDLSAESSNQPKLSKEPRAGMMFFSPL